MEIREWLIIIVFVAIVLILLDGFRRKWLERKYGLRVKLDKNTPKGGGDDLHPEFPNGGARKKYRDGSDNEEFEDVLINRSSTADSDREESYQDESFGRIEPSFGDNSIDEDEKIEESFDDLDLSVEIENNPVENAPTVEDHPIERPVAYTKKDQAELAFEQHTGSEEHQAPTEEVIVINVMAKADTLFAGKDLLPVLMKHNMRLGDMSIFHRYADSSGNGPVMFSMANMVQPGTFDISQMEEFSTPGISFFLQLPNVLDNMQCFEKMLDAANTVKSTLNGELKDENRSVITRQTIEHSRQRIRDFELKQLSKKK